MKSLHSHSCTPWDLEPSFVSNFVSNFVDTISTRQSLRPGLGRFMESTGCFFLMVASLFLITAQLQAQWLTQSLDLKAGWNAIYLHVDASHATIEELVGGDGSNPIVEIWQWDPSPSLQQYIQNPPSTNSDNTLWSNWERANSGAAALRQLMGNAAYLVRVRSDVATYTWTLKGKPVPPRYQWTSSGLNFLGFPTPPTSPPTFDSFFKPAPDLYNNIEIHRYLGGNLNPLEFHIWDIASLSLRRGEAFWVRCPDYYNRYFGPFEMDLRNAEGIQFRDTLGQYRIRLRNLTTSILTVTLELLPSESPPPNQSVIQPNPPPLLLRGERNATNLTYAYTDLTAGAQPQVLQPNGQEGSEVEIVLGLNRSQMSGNPGDLYAGILRLTDSLNLSQINLPISAQVSSTAGLWVGGAMVNSVHHYLKTFAHADTALEFTNLLTRLQLTNDPQGTFYTWDPDTSRVLVFGVTDGHTNTGHYLLDGAVKTDAGKVARPYPLRLIIHDDGSQARLLQQVYVGLGVGSNEVVATRQEHLLRSQLASARRISAVHLPWSKSNVCWSFDAPLQPGASSKVTIPLSYDDQAANPFLHTYHPDHDNRDATFENELTSGIESYDLNRQITLTVTAPDNDFDSLTSGNQTLSGNYAEEMTLGSSGESRQFSMRGYFSLQRISSIPLLTTANP